MAIILEPEEHAARIPNRFAVAVWAIAVLALAGLAAVARQHPAKAPGEDAERAIVFVCRNGVAMSVWSALSFDRLAAQRGLSVRAASRASTPSFREVPLRMRLALALDGFRVGDYRPRVISAEDVRGAERVILIDTELPPPASVPGAALETWSGFPPDARGVLRVPGRAADAGGGAGITTRRCRRRLPLIDTRARESLQKSPADGK